MVAAADDQVKRWRLRRPGPVSAIDRDMTETTFRVISATMFAGSADAEAAAIMKAADGALATISWDIAAAMLRVPRWMWFPGKMRRRRSARRLRTAVAAILARRRAAGLEGNDLLARLARAQDPETGAPMSERQLVDNLVTFLAAGHETTAKALTWTLYLLARAPQWQDRILAEVRAVGGEATGVRVGPAPRRHRPRPFPNHDEIPVGIDGDVGRHPRVDVGGRGVDAGGRLVHLERLAKGRIHRLLDEAARHLGAVADR